MDRKLGEPAAQDSAMVGSRNARDHAFLALFTLSLAWALLQIQVMVGLFGGDAGPMNSGEEGSLLHRVAESWGPHIVAVVAAILVSAFLVRFAPRFLRVSRRVTSLRLLLSLLVTAAIVAAALLVVPIGVMLIVDPPGPHPENVQYIPIAFWIAPWATEALTPVASVLIAWRWTARKSRR